MESDIFCCSREVPDEKEIEAVKAHNHVGEEIGAVRKIDGIFG
jgi:hypothetical protein